MWIRRAEMRCLLRDRDEWRSLFLSEREKRETERERNVRHEDALLNRFLTKTAGTYAVEERGAVKAEGKPEPKDALTPEQAELRDFFIESAKEHGKHESEGVAAFEAHLRGEPMPFEMVEG